MNGGILAACVLSAAIPACASFDRMGSAPLFGEPASTGLVVIEAEVDIIAALLGTRSSANPSGGWLVRENGVESVQGGTTSRGFSSNLLVFSNLTPGTWHLTRLEADWTVGSARHKKLYEIPLELVPQFQFEVQAGQPLHAGLLVEERGSDGSLRFERRAAEDTQKVWKHLAKIHASSPWAPIFKSLAER